MSRDDGSMQNDVNLAGTDHPVPSITVTTRTGQTVTVPGRIGASVMALITSGGVEELQALCGGSASCGTCHIYVDATSTAELPLIKGDERDLLDASEHRQTTSRLACQLKFSPAMEGLCVTIAPED